MKKEGRNELNVLIVECTENNNEILEIRRSIINLHEKAGSKRQLSVSLLDGQSNLFTQISEFNFQVVIVLNDNQKSELAFHYLKGCSSGKDVKFVVIGPETGAETKHAKFESAWIVSNTFSEVIPQFETLMGEK